MERFLLVKQKKSLNWRNKVILNYSCVGLLPVNRWVTTTLFWTNLNYCFWKYMNFKNMKFFAQFLPFVFLMPLNWFDSLVLGSRARPAHGHAHLVFRIHFAAGGERRDGGCTRFGCHQWICKTKTRCVIKQCLCSSIFNETDSPCPRLSFIKATQIFLLYRSSLFLSPSSHHPPSIQSQQHVLCDQPGPRHTALCGHAAHGCHVLLWRVRSDLSLYFFPK